MLKRLSVNSIRVRVANRTVLKDVSMEVLPGEVHVLMGPNGSGKSSFAYAIMGHPHYVVTSGSITLDGRETTKLSPDKRAQMGLFLAFQEPCALPGVTVSTLLKESYQAVSGKLVDMKEFENLLYSNMELLQMDRSYAQRFVHDGFSGGEQKRLELLQLLMLKPKVALLDEIDSGVDIDALKIISAGIAHVREQSPNISLIIITHYQRLLQHVQPDYVHVMSNGAIIASGDAALCNEIERHGYATFQSKNY